MKVRELEEKCLRLNASSAESSALAQSLEKKIDGLKHTLTESQEECAQLGAKVDYLQEKVCDLEDKLASANMMASSMESSCVSSEIQALQEENIELIRENKELRREASAYRVLTGKMKTQTGLTAASAGEQLMSTASVEPRVLSSGNRISDKENIPSNILLPIKDEDSVKNRDLKCLKNLDNSTEVGQKRLSQGTTGAGTIDSNDAAMNKMKRVRVKAKPLAESNSNDRMSDNPGECAQS